MKAELKSPQPGKPTGSPAEQTQNPKLTRTVRTKEQVLQEARLVKEILIPTLFRDSLPTDVVGIEGVKAYFDAVLSEAGNPTDPSNGCYYYNQ